MLALALLCSVAAGGPIWLGVSDAGSVTLTPLIRPHTIVASRERIRAFVQDGDRIAWLGDGCKVHVLALSDRAKTALPRGSGCHGFSVGNLALAGERALWTASSASNAETWGYFVTASISDATQRRLCKYNVMGGGDEDHQPAFTTAGDGEMLAFTMAGDPIESSPICDGLWRVDSSGRATKIATRAPLLLAVGGARLGATRTVSEGGCVCNAQPVWSPDGARIAFSSRRSGKSELYVIDADARNERRLGFGDSPAWSPVAAKLAFTRERTDGRAEVVTVNEDGSGEVVVGLGSGPQWSPSGSELAFVRELPGDHAAVVAADEGGTTERVLYKGDASAPPRWSPDGRSIAFTVSAVDDSQTYIVPAKGGTPRAVGRGALHSGSTNWSPDGTKIAVGTRGGQIYVLNADGSGQVRLTDGAFDLAPTWSPDGQRIAFVRGYYDTESDSLTNRRIWVMKADGSDPRRLTRSRRAEWGPQWSPDGAQIVFGPGELHLAAPSGTRVRQLTRTIPTEARSIAELRSTTGRLTSTLNAPGRVKAFALSRSRAALLVAGFFGRRIVFFDPLTGASRGSLPVPASTAPELSISGATAVFRVGNTIHLADGLRLTSRVLWKAKLAPIGLSIEGKRIAWAATSDYTPKSTYRGRIQMISLPG